jgi:tetratricopeptide (TPR) repeat protein
MKSRKTRSNTKKKRKSEKSSTSWQNAAMVLTLFLLSLLWISSFFPEKRLWGINHWGYFPLWLRSLVIAVALILLIPQVNRRVRTLLKNSVVLAFRSLAEEKRAAGYALLVIGSASVFYLLRTDFYLLGDGFQILENINSGKLSINWSQPLAIWIYLSSYRLLNQFMQLDGASVYALVSYLSGIIYVLFALRMALLLGRSTSTRLFVFLILVLLGSSQLFFGYAEHYPPLCCGILIYLFYSLRYLRGEIKILTPVVIFLLLLPLHFSSLYLFPSILFLLFFKEEGKNLTGLYKNKKVLLPLILSLVLLLALVLYISKYRWFALSYLVPLFHGGYTGPGYTLFSFPHIFDFINQQLLISPVGLILFAVLLIFKPGIKNFKNRAVIFLLLVSVSQLLFGFLINPGLGAARDWDLFASVGLGYTVLALYLFSEASHHQRVGHLKLNLTMLTLLFILPWILINAIPDKSVARFRNLLELDPRKSRSGHFILAGYFDRMGRAEEVDRENRKIKEKFPEVELVNQGYSSLAKGDLESAYQRFSQAMRLAPDFAEAHAGISWYYYKTGDLLKSEAELLKALQLKPDYQQGYMSLGEIYLQMGDLEKAERFYTRSVKLGVDDPLAFNNLGIIYAQWGNLNKAVSYYKKATAIKKDLIQSHYGLAHIYYKQGKSKESLRHVNLLLQIDPTYSLGYYQLGLTYERLGRKREATAAYQRYLEMEPHDPKAEYIRETIRRLETE